MSGVRLDAGSARAVYLAVMPQGRCNARIRRPRGGFVSI